MTRCQCNSKSNKNETLLSDMAFYNNLLQWKAFQVSHNWTLEVNVSFSKNLKSLECWVGYQGQIHRINENLWTVELVVWVPCCKNQLTRCDNSASAPIIIFSPKCIQYPPNPQKKITCNFETSKYYRISI